jgi:hypothetical protein
MKFHWFIWLPRIMLILLCLFFFIISFHVFGWAGSFKHHIKEFVIYNIPTVVLLIMLWFSRKFPFWSGILLIIIGFVFTLLFHTYRHNFNFDTTHQALVFLIKSGVPALTGVLFMIAQFLHPKAIETKETSS